jgi:signal peptide peptidase SppA
MSTLNLFYAPEKEYVQLEEKENFSILRLDGAICKDEVSYAAVESILAGKEIEKLLIWVNSDGGFVNETNAIVGYIDSLSCKKVTFIESTACSGGYKIALCGNKLYASPAATVGSIGVRYSHIDYSESLKKEGIIISEFSDPEGKVQGSPYHSLTPEEAEKIQKLIEKKAMDFFSFVAERRKLSIENIKSLDGGVFDVHEALDKGLIDEIINTSEVYVSIFKETTANLTIMTDNLEYFKNALEEAKASLAATKLEQETQKMTLDKVNLELTNLRAENAAFKNEFINRLTSYNKQLNGTNDVANQNYDALPAAVLIQSTHMYENLVKNKIENNMPMNTANTSRSPYQDILTQALYNNAKKNGGFY